MHAHVCCSRLKRESGSNLDAEQLLKQKEQEVRCSLTCNSSSFTKMLMMTMMMMMMTVT